MTPNAVIIKISTKILVGLGFMPTLSAANMVRGINTIENAIVANKRSNRPTFFNITYVHGKPGIKIRNNPKITWNACLTGIHIVRTPERMESPAKTMILLSKNRRWVLISLEI